MTWYVRSFSAHATRQSHAQQSTHAGTRGRGVGRADGRARGGGTRVWMYHNGTSSPPAGNALAFSGHDYSPTWTIHVSTTSRTARGTWLTSWAARCRMCGKTQVHNADARAPRRQASQRSEVSSAWASQWVGSPGFVTAAELVSQHSKGQVTFGQRVKPCNNFPKPCSPTWQTAIPSNTNMG